MTFDVFKFENQPELPIKSGANFISGYAFKSDDFCEAGIPVVKIKNIQNKVVDLNDSQHIPKNLISQKLEKFILSNGDVLIAMTGQGSVGRVGRLRCPSNVHPIMNQRVGKFLADELTLNRDYLFYVISSEKFEKRLFDLGAGSGQPNLSPTVILSVEIPFPKYRQQLAIAEILNSLDNRITLLRETNSTLEAIAQALFKSWFVDFDPVRAKQEGRQPEGMDAETAALFPDSFEQSELGEIPKGWGIGNLGDIFTLRNDRIKASTQTLLLPYVPIESIESKTLFLKKFKSGDEANSSLVLFKEGDILFGAMRPYFHKVCIAPFNGVTRTTVFTLAPIDFKATAFALFQAFQEQTVSYATKNSEGSTIPYAKWKNSLEKMAIVVPNQNLQRKFSEIVMPLINSGNENSSRSRTLACLHDTLLPRLISGQLRLPDVEEQIEAVLA